MQFKKIRDLIKIYHNDFGVPEVQIIIAEKKLGHSLPNDLKEYYRKFGNHNELIGVFEDVKKIEELKFDKDGYLVFFSDRQTAVKRGIRKEEINNPEPIVYSKENFWQEESKSIFKSLIALGFESAHFKLPFSAFRFDIEESEEQKVYANFIKLEEELQLWNSIFFQNQSNEIIRLIKSEEKTDLYIASNNEKDFLRIKNVFKDDWYSRENQLKKLRKKSNKRRN